MNGAGALNTPASGAAMNKPLREFAMLAGGGLIAAILLLAVGWVPTERLAGPEGMKAMFAGIGTSLAASLAGAVLICSARSTTPQARQVSMLAAMGLRMGLTLAVFAVLALMRVLPGRPLVVWTGVSYLVLLLVETIGVVRILKHRTGSQG